MGARELLHQMADAGFSVEIDGNMLLVKPASKLTDELRAELRAAKPALLALLSAHAEVGDRKAAPTQASKRPYKLSQAEGDAAHAEPWNDAGIARFVARVSLFLRRGINATDADDLAERLHLRDVQADDRVLCVECRHLAGRPGAWRCGNARVAGVGVDLPNEMIALPQRCMGFTTAVHADRTAP